MTTKAQLEHRLGVAEFDLEQAEENLRTSETTARAWKKKAEELRERLAEVTDELGNTQIDLARAEGYIDRVEVDDGFAWHKEHGRAPVEHWNPSSQTKETRPEDMPKRQSNKYSLPLRASRKP